MWGNRAGWIISVVIALLLGLLLYQLGTVGKPTPPSGEFANLTKPLALPVKPETVYPIFKEQRDAGDQYWQAIDEYVARKRDYDNFFTPKQEGFSRVKNASIVEPGMKLLLAAAPATEAKIFIRKPELLVNFKYPYPELNALEVLGRIAGQLGQSHAAAGNFDEAERHYLAEFSLGKKLFDERLNTTELSKGFGMMREANIYLARLAERRKQPARKAEIEAFDKQIDGWRRGDVDKLMKVIPSLGARDIERYAGDIFLLASRGEDRMLRAEALLKVGRYKFNAASYWDQMWAKRYLTQPERLGEADPTKDPDPAVRLAATIARDLTEEGYRQIDVTE